MLTGAHIVIYSEDAEADRAFFRDTLGFRSVDAGHGWLIFELPAEVAFHPHDRNNQHEMFFVCDDLKTEMAYWDRRVCVLARAQKNVGESARRCCFRMGV